MRCAAITRAGERCRLDATTGSYCYQHAPETAEERRRNARKGGKARGASELEEIKRGIRTVIHDVLSGKLDVIGRGAVALQGYNALLRAAEQERKNRETEDLEARVETLEQAHEREKGARPWRQRR